MKKYLFTSILLLSLIVSAQAQPGVAGQYFNAQIKQSGDLLQFYIRPNPVSNGGSNIVNMKFDNFDFFVRYPSAAPVATFGAPVVNTTDFPGLTIAQDVFGPEAYGSEAGFRIVEWTSPFGSATSAARTYNAGQEYLVFSVTVTNCSPGFQFSADNINGTPYFLTITRNTAGIGGFGDYTAQGGYGALTNQLFYNPFPGNLSSLPPSYYQKISSTDYFRSIASGNWNAPATWESSTVANFGTLLSPAPLSPDLSANDINIRSGNTVTVTANVTTDQTFVNPGSVLVVTGSTLTVSGNGLTIQSTAAGTGRVGNSTGPITGNVTVERFIKLRAGGTGRAYRLLTPTVNTTGSMRLNWMENGMNIISTTNTNPVPNYGTQISGAGGNANGFDITTSNAASIYATANAVTPTYTAINSTGSTLNAKTGYFMYVRGDRSMDMNLTLALGMPTSSTTLRATGSLLQGPQTSFTNAATGGGALNLVTNPYASPIDWSLVQPACANINLAYTYWDANIGTRGGFATVTTAGISAPATSATKFIQSGQAFFVQSNGAVPTVSIQESHKAAGDNNNVFLIPPTPVESFRTELYFTEPNGFRRVADGALALYDNAYSASVDANDAFEINNWDENIAIAREGKHLAIEGRPVIFKNDELPLFMNNMKQKAYEFEFTPSVFTNINIKAELIDNYLGTRTLLSVINPTVVQFTITADAASKATDRFKVVFGAFGSPQGIDAITIKASQQNSGVQVNWTSKTETDMFKYEVERQTYGTAYNKVNTTNALGNSSNPVNYTWFDANPVMGYNFYRIKGIDKSGNVRYSDMVKVLFGKGEPGIVVYPNPVADYVFKVDLNNLAKGTYLVDLYNASGQKVYSGLIQHDGSILVTKVINLNSDVSKGVYLLQMSSANGFKTTQKIIKN